MSFQAPNGDVFNSKKDYKIWLGHVDNAKRHIVLSTDVAINRKNNHNGSCKRKAICPKCGRIDNLTRDWYGSLLCPDCFRKSL